jgi:hypothetical protein
MLRVQSFKSQTTALDVTVVSSLQKELRKRAAAEVGSAAARRHGDKNTKYFRDSDREGIQFLPIVVEALGGWHSDAAAAVSKLARQLASHTGTLWGTMVFFAILWHLRAPRIFTA